MNKKSRPAVVITTDQFTQLLNHFLLNLNLFVSTTVIEESKTENAPSKHGFSVILGNSLSTKSELAGLLNTYCEEVTLISNEKLGIIAQCEVLVGATSTLPEPTNPESSDNEKDVV